MNKEILRAVTRVQGFYSKARFAFLSERDVQGRLYHELVGAFGHPQPHPIEEKDKITLGNRSGVALHTEGWAYQDEAANGIPDMYITQPRSIQASLKMRRVDYHDPKDSIGIEIKLYFERRSLGSRQRAKVVADIKKLAAYSEGWFIAASSSHVFADEKEWRALFAELRRRAGRNAAHVVGCYLCPALGRNPWIAR